jgi:hypothetical protein
MTTDAINKGTFKDELYEATFRNVTVKLYAHSLPSAKQRAIEHFKPKKKEVQFIWISKP